MTDHLTPHGLMSVDQVNRLTNIFIDETQLIEIYFIGFDRILSLDEKMNAIKKLGIKRESPLVTNFPGGISVISEAIERHSVSVEELEEKAENEGKNPP